MSSYPVRSGRTSHVAAMVGFLDFSPLLCLWVSPGVLSCLAIWLPAGLRAVIVNVFWVIDHFESLKLMGTVPNTHACTRMGTVLFITSSVLKPRLPRVRLLTTSALLCASLFLACLALKFRCPSLGWGSNLISPLQGVDPRGRH